MVNLGPADDGKREDGEEEERGQVSKDRREASETLQGSKRDDQHVHNAVYIAQ